MPADVLATVERFDFDDLPSEYGRIEVWEHPHPDHVYAAGSDFAYGIEGKDYDTCCVLDITVKPIRQVAEAHVHLGERFDRLLFAMVSYYNEAFLCGERQVGLWALRALLSEYGHTWLFYDRDEEAKGRKLTDKLGYWRGSMAGDVTIPNLRRALRAGEIALRSRPTIEQLSRLQYAPRRVGQDPSEAMDRDLGIKLKGGGSPDLVMALAYAWHAARELPKFPRPPRRYHPRSLGAILGHEVLDNPPEPDMKSWRQRRRRR